MKNKNFNIPNILTAIRIILIPIVAAMFYKGHMWLATVLFLTAGFTDLLDGYIARKFDLITNVGKVLDPIADKGMSLTVIICMWYYARLIPGWAVLIFLSKEIIMFLAGAALLAEQIIIPALWYGKASTAITTLCVVTLMCVNGFSLYMPEALRIALITFTAAFAVFALVMYAINMLKVVRASSKKIDIT